jgi:hypothetical protein
MSKVLLCSVIWNFEYYYGWSPCVEAWVYFRNKERAGNFVAVWMAIIYLRGGGWAGLFKLWRPKLICIIQCVQLRAEPVHKIYSHAHNMHMNSLHSVICITFRIFKYRTNKCTYIVFNNLKCTLKHLKRSYAFRSYDHPQGAYFVPW